MHEYRRASGWNHPDWTRKFHNGTFHEYVSRNILLHIFGRGSSRAIQKFWKGQVVDGNPGELFHRFYRMVLEIGGDKCTRGRNRRKTLIFWWLLLSILINLVFKRESIGLINIVVL